MLREQRNEDYNLSENIEHKLLIDKDNIDIIIKRIIRKQLSAYSLKGLFKLSLQIAYGEGELDAKWRLIVVYFTLQTNSSPINSRAQQERFIGARGKNKSDVIKREIIF